MTGARTEESRFHENPLAILAPDFSQGMVLAKECRQWLPDRASEGS